MDDVGNVDVNVGDGCNVTTGKAIVKPRMTTIYYFKFIKSIQISFSWYFFSKVKASTKYDFFDNVIILHNLA